MNRTRVAQLMLVCLFVSTALSQEREGTIESYLQNQAKSSAQQLSQLQAPALQAPVNPETYIVGPGDVFGIGIWTVPPLTFSIPVTLEGTMIVPTVGEIPVAGSTLSEAKKAVILAIQGKYLKAVPSVTLASARRVVVFVNGHVAMPGTYTLYATDRVDKAIRLADGEPDLDRNRQVVSGRDEFELKQFSRKYLETMSWRKIIVRKRDGTNHRVDLIKFLASSGDQWNPTLDEGDQIIVPKLDDGHNSIGVFGAVNLPGSYEFVGGETVRDAIAFGRGFALTAIRDSILLLRGGSLRNPESRRILNYTAIVDGKSEDVVLEPGDRLVVSMKRELRSAYGVAVEGEVMHPGFYPITREDTRLSEVIAMAGGFTPYASLNAAHILRVKVPDPSMMDSEYLKALRGTSLLDDSTYYRIEQQTRFQQEAVHADFVQLFGRNDTAADVVIHINDRIIVPPRTGSVYIYGEVVNPGHVPFLPGSSLSYYVQASGGYGEDALKGEVLIIKAGSQTWLHPDKTTIEDGDAIWVPKDMRQPFAMRVATASQIASIVSVILSMTFVIIQLTKQ